jgi:phosphate-selective porin OprO and OprP
MKFSKLTMAIAVALTAGASSSAFAIELYVDTKTKQIYAEPGKGRELMGQFERVGDHVPHKGEHDFIDAAAIHQDLELKENEIKALQEHITEAEKTKVSMDNNGLQVRSADNNFKFRIGGRLQADASYHGGGDYLTKSKPHTRVEPNDGTELRRARMRLEGVFYKDWLGRLEADFADDNVRVKDAYIQYLGLPKYAIITAGQQKQNFSKELQESSNDMMFMERSLMNVLNAPTVDRAIGLNFEHFDTNWVAKFGMFGDSITPNTNTNLSGEGWGLNSRVTYAPILEKTKLIHLGIAGNYRTPDDDGTVAKNKALQLAYETTNMSNFDPINTTVKSISDIKMLGLEAAGMYGPFSVSGEYTRQWIDRKDKLSNLTFDGWYADAAWTITGESRTYKNGNFTYLAPAKPFNLSTGDWGAFEVATRYSAVDLNSGNYLGGNMSNVTAAINWYVNKNVRFMADYTRLLSVKNGVYTTTSGGNVNNLDTFMLRGQLAF